MHITIGIDNGTTGSIGVLGMPKGPRFFLPPTKVEQDYTKSKNNITRIDFPEYVRIFKSLFREIKAAKESFTVRAYVERPAVNQRQFKTSGRALRTLEATLILLEQFEIGHEIVDSKQWQKVMLPDGTTTTPKLKKASRDIGTKLFPEFKDDFKKQGDADGMLIAEWARLHR